MAVNEEIIFIFVKIIVSSLWSNPLTRIGSLWSLVSVTSIPVTIRPYTLLLSLSRYTLAILACSLAMSCNLEVHLHVQGCARLYIKLVVDQGACLKKKHLL